MATKQALAAMDAARKAAEREMRRWDGILTKTDYENATQNIAYRAANAAIRAWRAKMKEPRP